MSKKLRFGRKRTRGDSNAESRKPAKRGRPPEGQHEGNSVAFSIRVRPELLLQIDQEAASAGKSRSQHVQDLLHLEHFSIRLGVA